MFERFTEPTRQVVVFAREEAGLLEHNYIGSEHVLLGLVREEEGVAGSVHRDMGLALESARGQVVKIARPSEEVAPGQLPLTRPAIKVLELALRELLAFGDPYVGTAHVLLGLTRAKDDVADRLLLDLGAAPDRAAAEVLRLRSATDGSWAASAWDEPLAAETHAVPRGGHKRMRATSVRAAMEVAIVAANTKGHQRGPDGRPRRPTRRPLRRLA